MKLRALSITNFAAIGSVRIEFGPGLNVLYGPNDLGKSSIAAAIRLGLLLPHGSSHAEAYSGWTVADDPFVEITFETEAQRIWRVRKRFAKSSGSSFLQESKNGVDFDEVERGRAVDGRLREILRWGIPEPGGAGAAKGMPTSFLATALLSPQGDVGAILRETLQNDPAVSGKDQIAAALQAVAQDPLFGALLRNVQSRRDEAYTEKGAIKTAKGSVLKLATERVNQARIEKDRFQRIVSESESTEWQIQNLTDRRREDRERLDAAHRQMNALKDLVAIATLRSAGEQQLRMARDEVTRVRKIASDAEAKGIEVALLARRIAEANEVLALSKDKAMVSRVALHAAEEEARANGAEPALAETVARQQLEIERSTAEQAVRVAEREIEAALAAHKLIDAVAAAERDFRVQEGIAVDASEAAFKSNTAMKAISDSLERCELLERALDVREAEAQVKNAQVARDQAALLRDRLRLLTEERGELNRRRSSIKVPVEGSIGAMRRLATDLERARGALDVGFVVTVTPKLPVSFEVRCDAQRTEVAARSEMFEIEANAEVEVSIAELAIVRVQGGRREAQQKVKDLESRWQIEIEPYLSAAGVRKLEGLEEKIEEARSLDTSIRSQENDIRTVMERLAAGVDADEALTEATRRLDVCRSVFGDEGFEATAVELAELGVDAAAQLKRRKQQLAREAEPARRVASQAATARTLADERARAAREALEAAIAARDAIEGLPEVWSQKLASARAALAAAVAARENTTDQLASLARTIEAKKERADALLAGARTNFTDAARAVEAAEGRVTAAKTGHASQEGRLIELERLRDAENASLAELAMRDAAERLAALPVPQRSVSTDELSVAERSAATLQADLECIEREIQKAQGALEQVGGAVARERLSDATEAYELAERREREIEAEYEAWRLLLDHMKEADAAQASNLGQALVPAIAGRFQELTNRRYGSVQLNSHLATQGILASGGVRSVAQLSVGTREQLSTLYRLSLAEYLQSTIVLDDQLVQSDESRMDWFRALLAERSQKFQIVVFTCRPGDYLAGTAVSCGTAISVDSSDGFLRAVDLGKTIRRQSEVS